MLKQNQLKGVSMHIILRLRMHVYILFNFLSCLYILPILSLYSINESIKLQHTNAYCSKSPALWCKIYDHCFVFTVGLYIHNIIKPFILA